MLLNIFQRSINFKLYISAILYTFQIICVFDLVYSEISNLKRSYKFYTLFVLDVGPDDGFAAVCGVKG